MIGNSNQGGVFFSSRDHDREKALSIGLNFAATVVQVVCQHQGASPDLLSIIAIVVSLCACLGYNYFSPTYMSAALSCSRVALFSASLAMASVLAAPLHGILKYIPSAVCFFPLLSLLSALYSCLKGSHPNPDFAGASNRPSPSSSTISMETVVPIPDASWTVNIAVGINARVADGDEQASVADEETGAASHAAISFHLSLTTQLNKLGPFSLDK